MKIDGFLSDKAWALLFGAMTICALSGWIYACIQPAPQPKPTPTATPAPSHEPTVVPCVPPGEAQAWKPAGTPENISKAAVRAAQEQLGDVCGEDPTATLERLAAALRDAGVCAGRMTDGVFVETDRPTLYEEWHPVYFGNGCWATNNAKGLWERLP